MNVKNWEGSTFLWKTASIDIQQPCFTSLWCKYIFLQKKKKKKKKRRKKKEKEIYIYLSLSLSWKKEKRKKRKKKKREVISLGLILAYKNSY
jgi:hypothetical protein